MKKISTNFLKRERIINLLKSSIKNKITYVSAPIGCGKTIAVQQLQKDMQCDFFWFDCEFEKKINFNKINKYIVIENFNKVDNETRKNILNYISKNKSSKFIILSRKQLDIDLKNDYYAGQVVLIENEDLLFSKQETNELFKLNNVNISEVELSNIYTDIKGYPLICNFLIEYLHKEQYSKKIFNALKSHLFEYIDLNVFNKVEKEIMEFLYKISFLEEIDIDLINYIFSIKNSEELLEKAENIGSFLKKNKYEKYEIINIAKLYLNEKSKISKQNLKNIYLKSAEYYENKKKNLILAVEYYIWAEEYERAANLLMEEDIQHLGVIKYNELQKYILKIPNEIVDKYPKLCITVAHLCMLNCKNKEAEKWYKKFLKLKEKSKKNNTEYDELNQMDMYYKICMPTTNDIKLMDYFNILSNTVKGKSILKRITFTGNQPSILSGGKDLSNWGKHYKIAYLIINHIVVNFFKESQIGSSEIAVADLLYQTNNMDGAIEYITKGISISKNIDNLFAGYSILDKIMLSKNEKSIALQSFYNKIQDEKAWYLEQNYQARIMENNILYGNKEVLIDWIEKNNINIIENFNMLDKYKYITLARAYIAIEKYTEALIILERIYEYANEYGRRIYKIECFILKSICFYRQDKIKEAIKNINEAILLAYRFNYIRLFADEGLVVYDILNMYSKDKEINKKIKKSKYLKNIIDESKKYGEMYPNKYKLQCKYEDLTKKELEILKLIVQGNDNHEICEILSISMATVKTHINHIYSKLGTKNRIQLINKIKNQTKG